MAREKRTFKSASYFYFFNAGFDFSATLPAADLFSTCYRYMQCIGQSIHFVCSISSAHDTKLKQILCVEFPKA